MSDDLKACLWEGPRVLFLVTDCSRPILRWPDNALVARVVNLKHWGSEVPEKGYGQSADRLLRADFQETPNIPDVLPAEGIRYVCDWGNAGAKAVSSIMELTQWI